MLGMIFLKTNSRFGSEPCRGIGVIPLDKLFEPPVRPLHLLDEVYTQTSDCLKRETINEESKLKGKTLCTPIPRRMRGAECFVGTIISLPAPLAMMASDVDAGLLEKFFEILCLDV